jgi:tetratricopeptide (TPR) repeat protein
MTSAADLRRIGNELFQQQNFADASSNYREALAIIKASETGSGDADVVLSKAVRLNLASCCLQMGDGLDEAVALCSEVLAVEPGEAKARFKRGSALQEQARRLENPVDRRNKLKAAKQDFVQALQSAPNDRQLRARFEEVNAALRDAQEAGADDGSFLKGYFGRNLKKKGLYEDREASTPALPVICSVCGRPGHPRCGRDLWVAERARWLNMPEEEVGREPPSFEHGGTLEEARLLQSKCTVTPPPDLSDLSDEERDVLEDCLESTCRPFPCLIGRLRLPVVVQCAEQLWHDA